MLRTNPVKFRMDMEIFRNFLINVDKIQSIRTSPVIFWTNLFKHRSNQVIFRTHTVFFREVTYIFF